MVWRVDSLAKVTMDKMYKKASDLGKKKNNGEFDIRYQLRFYWDSIEMMLVQFSFQTRSNVHYCFLHFIHFGLFFLGFCSLCYGSYSDHITFTLMTDIIDGICFVTLEAFISISMVLVVLILWRRSFWFFQHACALLIVLLVFLLELICSFSF